MCQRGSFWSGGLWPMISPRKTSGPSVHGREQRQQDVGEEVIQHDGAHARDHDRTRGAKTHAATAATGVVALVTADGSDDEAEEARIDEALHDVHRMDDVAQVRDPLALIDVLDEDGGD